MEPQQNKAESIIAPLRKATPLSKYLAMVIFIAMPFIGGYLGYTYAPERIVEIQTSIPIASAVTSSTTTEASTENEKIPDPKYVVMKKVYSSYVIGTAPYEGTHLIYKGNVIDDSLVYSSDGRFLLFMHEPLSGTEDTSTPFIYDFVDNTTHEIEFYGDEQTPYVMSSEEDSIAPMEQFRYRKSVTWGEDNRLVYVVEYEGKQYVYETAPQDEPWFVKLKQ